VVRTVCPQSTGHGAPDGALFEPLLDEEADDSDAEEGAPAAFTTAKDDKSACIVDRASPLARLSFSFMFPTLKAGFAGQLTQAKLGAVPKVQRTSHVNREFEAAWGEQRRLHGKKASVAWALARAFFGPFATASLCKAVYDCLQFVGPQVLNAIILYLDPTAQPASWVAWVGENYQGYFIVLVLLCSGLFQVRVRLPGSKVKVCREHDECSLLGVLPTP
jgi:hypothetical protein